MSKVLTQNTIATLSAHTYRTDAKRQVCLLPLAGIYWNDELPNIRELFKLSEGDREQIFRLFGIRCRIWKGEVPTDDDQNFWNDTQSQTPKWAFFQRLEISPKDLQVQLDTERDTTQGLQQLFADADEASVTEKNGIQRFSLTFDLTKSDRTPVKTQPWWKRIFSRRQRSE